MPSSVFIGRQPILNRNQQIIGYELLFRSHGQAQSADIDSDLQAGLSVLRDILTSVDTDFLLGNKLAFINVGERILQSNFLDLLQPQRVVLECNIQNAPNEALINRLRDLRQQGFNIALDNFTENSPVNAVLPFVNYLKVIPHHHDIEQLTSLSTRLRQHTNAIQIAKHVETPAQFHACLKAGFDGFQGYYFARPETLSAKTIHPPLTNIIHTLNLLRNNADVHEVEHAIKTDVAMSYKLFRYINSVGFAPQHEISSITQILNMLGYQRLYRWLTLLLVSTSKDIGLPSALIKTAIIRARFAELLGHELNLPEDNNELFIVGLFSMLDVMLDTPFTRILDNMMLPETVAQALLHHAGQFGTVLNILEACEDRHMQNLPALSATLGISADSINQAHMNAMAWVEELQL